MYIAMLFGYVCDLIKCIILNRPGSQISSSSPAEALTKVITDTFEVVEHSQYEAPG